MGSKIEDSTMLEPLGETVARISCIHHDGAKGRAAHEAVAKMTATGHPLCEPCVNGILRLERGLRGDPPTDEPVRGEGEGYSERDRDLFVQGWRWGRYKGHLDAQPAWSRFKRGKLDDDQPDEEDDGE